MKRIECGKIEVLIVLKNVAHVIIGIFVELDVLLQNMVEGLI